MLFYRSTKEHNDSAFRWMWLTIVLSFGFYIPVVLWADTFRYDRYADDPQDLRLCVDGADQLLRYEKRVQVTAQKIRCVLSTGSFFRGRLPLLNRQNFSLHK